MDPLAGLLDLSQEVLELLSNVSDVQKVSGDLPEFLRENYGLGKLVAGALADPVLMSKGY